MALPIDLFERYPGLRLEFILTNGKRGAVQRAVRRMVRNASRYYGWTELEFYRNAAEFFGTNALDVLQPDPLGISGSHPDLPLTVEDRQERKNRFYYFTGPNPDKRPEVHCLPIGEWESRLRIFHDAVMRENDGDLSNYRLAVERICERHDLPMWRVYIVTAKDVEFGNGLPDRFAREGDVFAVVDSGEFAASERLRPTVSAHRSDPVEGSRGLLESLSVGAAPRKRSEHAQRILDQFLSSGRVEVEEPPAKRDYRAFLDRHAERCPGIKAGYRCRCNLDAAFDNLDGYQSEQDQLPAIVEPEPMESIWPDIARKYRRFFPKEDGEES